MGQLLLVDDDPDLILAQMNHVFGGSQHSIDVARTGEDGVRSAAEQAPDVILLDLRLPDLSGLDVYQRIRQIDARIPVVFITAATAAHHAIEAMKQGAYDYLIKPLDTQHLRRVVGQALELSRLSRKPAVVAESPPEEEHGDAIIGCCPSMLEVFKAIGRVAAQDVTVLITGESGTGKELVARAIYQHGARAKGPFLAINCAAIPDALLESELFGHEKGAFTGAERRRIGKFEQCSGGTLFLDEVGDMPMATQGKVLRLLQDQAFERVGGNETIQTDVRLIAATNRDLEEDAAGGRYRPDLYYRLSVFTIQLPPLRERGDDLPMLVSHYVRRFNRELDRDVRELTPEAMDLMRGYPWPGNIRELQSVLKQTLLRVTGPVVTAESLPAPVSAYAEPPRADRTAADGGPERAPIESFVRERMRDCGEDLYQDVHRHVDLHLLPLVLHSTGGNQLRAAELLGITRRTLRLKLRELGLSVTKTVESAEGDDAD
jgi:two-component system nitrogen regulation response regulator GlnG